MHPQLLPRDQQPAQRGRFLRSARSRRIPPRPHLHRHQGVPSAAQFQPPVHPALPPREPPIFRVCVLLHQRRERRLLHREPPARHAHGHPPRGDYAADAGGGRAAQQRRRPRERSALQPRGRAVGEHEQRHPRDGRRTSGRDERRRQQQTRQRSFGWHLPEPEYARACVARTRGRSDRGSPSSSGSSGSSDSSGADGAREREPDRARRGGDGGAGDGGGGDDGVADDAAVPVSLRRCRRPHRAQRRRAPRRAPGAHPPLRSARARAYGGSRWRWRRRRPWACARRRGSAARSERASPASLRRERALQTRPSLSAKTPS
mmetsp:Transcript_18556/g.60461  ORF Transcript_18556/g.60461 Transcript_18556/m.60461 type:complete len:318 (+) Transcript_18556:636-1589(+)